ncbi:RDD family protein [Azomonas macrocytogenes]|uniref:Putative RDD family membrane protein YckC n=1 Tax=Azomonas macrocytogenes TaxID=69962 RepID=A0A839T5K7_AZOMA|nr:RDD family protein [Azomonas macrocytogenes]MBB3104070.1 putative RDD family membrane protein YckC [Azomonas macrocytogenes]
MLSPQLDNRHAVETPEGIELLLTPAGLLPRALAFAVDLGIRGAILGLLILVPGLLDRFGLGLAMILVFMLQWLYMVLFEVLNQGRTPGKQWLGLQVIQDDGSPVGWASSLTRNLLRMVDLLPFGYFFGVLSCLWHPSFKRLGDLAAGTLVIHQGRPIKRAAPTQLIAQAPLFVLLQEEKLALLDFAERYADFSQERRRELAGILAASLRTTPDKAEQQLLAIAHGLLGRA